MSKSVIERLEEARKFVRDEELGGSTEGQGIHILEELAPYFDIIPSLKGRELAIVADVFVCMGQMLSNRLMKESNRLMKSQNKKTISSMLLDVKIDDSMF